MKSVRQNTVRGVCTKRNLRFSEPKNNRMLVDEKYFRNAPLANAEPRESCSVFSVNLYVPNHNPVTLIKRM